MTPSQQIPVSLKHQEEENPEIPSDTDSEPEVNQHLILPPEIIAFQALQLLEEDDSEDDAEYNNFQISAENKIKKDFYDTLKLVILVYFTFVFADYVCFRLGYFSEPYMIRPPIRPIKHIIQEHLDEINKFSTQQEHLDRLQQFSRRTRQNRKVRATISTSKANNRSTNGKTLLAQSGSVCTLRDRTSTSIRIIDSCPLQHQNK
jgi:hypothetical protein